MKYPEEKQLAERIEKTIIAYRRPKGEDDSLVAALEDIVDADGEIACRVIFQVMASADFTPQKASVHWRKVLAHRLRMSKDLGRQVLLLPALCDYLSAFIDEPCELKLVDVRRFNEVVNDTIHDGLTSIYNRHYFDKTFEQQLSTAQRYDNELSILFLDVDDFKDVNDTFGHQAGDKALQTIAQIVSEEKRESDVVARYGGEEFVVLMPHTNNVNALILAERIRNKVKQARINSNGDTFSLTISGGIASFPVHGKEAQALMSRADNALYQAKGAGKDNIAQYKQDKRRYLRVKFREQIRIKELGFNSTEPFSAMSKDICSGGVLFENPKPLPIGMRIQVSIPIQDGEPLLLIGTVVRVEVFDETSCDIGMAISFKEMDKIANTEIAEFLKRQRMSG